MKQAKVKQPLAGIERHAEEHGAATEGNIDRVENEDGVHIMIGEFTLCGDAYDAPETEGDWEAGSFLPTKRRTVTCERCTTIILICKAARVAKP